MSSYITQYEEDGKLTVSVEYGGKEVELKISSDTNDTSVGLKVGDYKGVKVVNNGGKWKQKLINSEYIINGKKVKVELTKERYEEMMEGLKKGLTDALNRGKLIDYEDSKVIGKAVYRGYGIEEELKGIEEDIRNYIREPKGLAEHLKGLKSTKNGQVRKGSVVVVNRYTSLTEEHNENHPYYKNAVIVLKCKERGRKVSYIELEVRMRSDSEISKELKGNDK